MYHISEQHKKTTKARQQRDYKDTDELITFLSQRNPFNPDPSLRSITSGVVAEDDVNANKAKEVGRKTLSLMVGKNVYNYSFRRKDQVVTLASKTAVRFVEGTNQVDPQLLFQRLNIFAIGGQYEDPKSMFKWLSP